VLDAIAARDADGAREATTILLNQAAGDLVKIRGRDFAKTTTRTTTKTPAKKSPAKAKGASVATPRRKG
jgi:hypothetical protein